MVPRQIQADSVLGSTHPKSCHSLLPGDNTHGVVTLFPRGQETSLVEVSTID